MRAALTLTAKIAISGATLYLVAGTVAWNDVSRALGKADFLCLLLALATFWAAQVASSMRCVYVAQALGGRLGLGLSLHAHFVGLWFNQVLPSSLGGDVVKVAVLNPPLGLSLAIRAAILDRVSGFVFLMVAVTLGLPFYAGLLAAQPGLALALSILSITCLAALVPCTLVARHLIARRHVGPKLTSILQVFADLWAFHRGMPLWRQVWTSALVHCNGIAAYALIGTSLGYVFDLFTFALIVPLVFLIALVPVSFAGWGVREAGAVWLFGLTGMPAEKAIAMSVGFGLLLIVAALPGLLLLARSGAPRVQIKKGATPAEQQ